jgi:holin-like protein
LTQLKIIIQIFLLWLIYQLGNIITSTLHLPLPGNVLGMLLLFALLTTGIVPVKWIKEGADLLLKHLAFFFIPIAVGLMAWTKLFATSGIWLLLALLISALLAIPISGWAVQLLSRRREKEVS